MASSHIPFDGIPTAQVVALPVAPERTESAPLTTIAIPTPEATLIVRAPPEYIARHIPCRRPANWTAEARKCAFGGRFIRVRTIVARSRRTLIRTDRGGGGSARFVVGDQAACPPPRRCRSSTAAWTNWTACPRCLIPSGTSPSAAR